MSTPVDSMIETTAPVTSGPMPSPGRRVIRCFKFELLPQAGVRGSRGEGYWKRRKKGPILRQILDAGSCRLGGRREKIEVVTTLPADCLPCERPHDFQRSLQERL